MSKEKEKFFGKGNCNNFWKKLSSKRNLLISALVLVLLVSGCQSQAEKICNDVDFSDFGMVNLVDKHTCELGNPDSAFTYGFTCGKDTIKVYSDKDADFKLGWQFSSCSYVKVRNHGESNETE